MNQEFLNHLWNKQQQADTVPSNTVIADWALNIIYLLYPEHNKITSASTAELDQEFVKLEQQLLELLELTTACKDCNNALKARQFFTNIPELYRVLNTDVSAILSGDPAAKTQFEVVRAYPGFLAICFYRIAHALLALEIPLLPRILTEYAHSKTGIDIHPGARIDEYFCIDHGTGVVIGETCVIGKYVKIYQGVTLGALSVDLSMASVKRHPTVEDYVVIYSGATILGGNTVVGQNSIIGGNVWLTKSVRPGSMVYHTSDTKVVERQKVNK
jgi:serine O-acetyltransferase